MASNSLTTPYLVLSGVIIVSLAGVVTVLQPLFTQTQEAREQITNTRTQLTAREDFLRTLDAKVAALTREREHEQQLNVVLPTGEEHEDVVRLLHQAQVASGGVIRRLNNISASVQSSLNARRARGETVTVPENVAPLGVEVDFAGSYQQLRVFLDHVVRAPRLLDVVSLEIRRSPQTLDAITATLLVHFYRYHPADK